MSVCSDALKQGFDELLDCVEQTLTLKGVNHDCVATRIKSEWPVTVGGIEHNVDITFEISATDALTADSTLITVDSTLWTVDAGGRTPLIGYKVTYQGAEYRILQTSYNEQSDTFSIVCGSVDQ